MGKWGVTGGPGGLVGEGGAWGCGGSRRISMQKPQVSCKSQTGVMAKKLNKKGGDGGRLRVVEGLGGCGRI